MIVQRWSVRSSFLSRLANMCILANMNSFSLKPSHLFNDGAEMVSEEFLSLQAGEHVHLSGYELLLCSVVSLLCLQEILNKKVNLENVSK